MGAAVFLVDAFTSEAFAGNPAAVCLPEVDPPAAWMQAVAAELGFSETAFARPRGDGWRLRWFTPAVEVDLCGHATLATAHVLWETGRLAPGAPARFRTRGGALAARPVPGGIELDLPADPPVEEPAGGRPVLAAALGVPAAAVRASAAGRTCRVVELDAAAAVAALVPDLDALAALRPPMLAVTARDDDGVHDVVSRVFAPAVGIPEDPVTGSAHCTLAGWWCPRLGRHELVARQASARGGSLRVRVAGDRVLLAGRAVTVARGELLVGP